MVYQQQSIEKLSSLFVSSRTPSEHRYQIRQAIEAFEKKRFFEIEDDNSDTKLNMTQKESLA